MPCTHIRVNGVSAIVCGPKPRKRKCAYCSKPAPYLCDHKQDGVMCNKPICGDHARSMGKDIDWCKSHPLTQPQGILTF